MTVVRALARPLLSSIFIVQGMNSIRNPEPLVPKAQPVTDRLVPLVKKVAPAQVGDRIPETTANLVRLHGAVQVVSGLALATGKGRRLGGLLLAAVDTEGKPGVAWRASHGAKAAKRETKGGAKAAKREAKELAR